MRQFLFSVASLVLAICASAPWAVAAQTIRGQVVDSVTGEPLPKGFVVLTDENGQDVARGLTDDAGRFVMSLLTPGRYRIISERISYRVWASDPINVPDRTTVDVTLRITAIPSRLAEIRVTSSTECRPAWEGVDTGTLWEEARKALEAASWAAEEQLYDYRLHHFEHTRIRGRPLVVDVSATEGTATAPFRAESIHRLIQEGYVINEDDEWVFYAPDANVLLDQRFHETHCFGTERGEGEFEGLIGLTFHPVSSRRQADITGVLWLDPVSSELRRIEYEYERLPFSTSRTIPGGSTYFEALDSGAWIVNEWVIRMPITQRSRTLSSTRIRSVLSRFNGEAHEGAIVIEAFSLDGTRVYVHPEMVHMRGAVYDSITDQPLRDELVTVVGTGYETRTDSNGVFQVNTLLQGEYEVTSSRLDSLGYVAGRVRTRFEPGDTLNTTFAVPSLSTIYDYLCDAVRRTDQFIVVGQVRNDLTDEPLSDVNVAAAWADDNVQDRTDEEGWFVLCELPDDHGIQVAVHGRDYSADPVIVTYNDGMIMQQTTFRRRQYSVPEGIWRLDLWVRPRR